MRRGGSGRRRALLAGVVVVGSVLLVGTAPAPAQAADPELNLWDSFPPSVFAYTDCDGVVHRQDDLEGLARFALDDAPATTLTVPVTYSGSLADDLVDPPTEVTFTPASVYGDLTVTFGAVVEGSLVVTPQPGPGYVLGPNLPLTVLVEDPLVVADCAQDLGSPPDGADRQTITVGERPDPLGFVQLGDGSGDPVDTDGYSTPVGAGTVPPGLVYATDVWSGAATTPGTYAFDVHLCQVGSQYLPFGDGPGAPAVLDLPDPICFGTVDVTVVVEAASGGSPGGSGPAAPPASAVDAPARFAG
jgi:hypothetical protein